MSDISTARRKTKLAWRLETQTAAERQSGSRQMTQ